MNALLAAELIVKVGLPVAEKLFQLYQNGNKPLTQADFDELTALAAYRSADSLAGAGLKKDADGKIVPV